jgi:hypothetical protein
MDLDQARSVLLELLKDDDWQFTETARRDGYLLGFTEFSMVDLILEKLDFSKHHRGS